MLNYCFRSIPCHPLQCDLLHTFYITTTHPLAYRDFNQEDNHVKCTSNRLDVSDMMCLTMLNRDILNCYILTSIP